MIDYLKTSQGEKPLPETELVYCIWTALMASVDWSVPRADQVDPMAAKEMKVSRHLCMLST